MGCTLETVGPPQAGHSSPTGGNRRRAGGSGARPARYRPASPLPRGTPARAHAPSVLVQPLAQDHEVEETLAIITQARLVLAHQLANPGGVLPTGNSQPPPLGQGGGPTATSS